MVLIKRRKISNHFEYKQIFLIIFFKIFCFRTGNVVILHKISSCMEYEFCKNEPSDKIWWVDDPEHKGAFLFSFDKKVVFNLFADYPDKLTPQQRKIFDRENPYWADFFSNGK